MSRLGLIARALRRAASSTFHGGTGAMALYGGLGGVSGAMEGYSESANRGGNSAERLLAAGIGGAAGAGYGALGARLGRGTANAHAFGGFAPLLLNDGRASSRLGERNDTPEVTAQKALRMLQLQGMPPTPRNIQAAIEELGGDEDALQIALEGR